MLSERRHETIDFSPPNSPDLWHSFGFSFSVSGLGCSFSSPVLPYLSFLFGLPKLPTRGILQILFLPHFVTVSTHKSWVSNIQNTADQTYLPCCLLYLLSGAERVSE